MESSQAFCVSPVSACPAASRAQICLPACWFVSASMTVDGIAAIVDRVTFNAHILETGTPSYRLRTSKTTSRSRKPS